MRFRQYVLLVTIGTPLLALHVLLAPFVIVGKTAEKIADVAADFAAWFADKLDYRG